MSESPVAGDPAGPADPHTARDYAAVAAAEAWGAYRRDDGLARWWAVVDAVVATLERFKAEPNASVLPAFLDEALLELRQDWHALADRYPAEEGPYRGCADDLKAVVDRYEREENAGG